MEHAHRSSLTGGFGDAAIFHAIFAKSAKQRRRARRSGESGQGREERRERKRTTSDPREEGEAGNQANGEASGNETSAWGRQRGRRTTKIATGGPSGEEEDMGRREQEVKQKDSNPRTEGTSRRCQQNATDVMERLKTG